MLQGHSCPTPVPSPSWLAPGKSCPAVRTSSYAALSAKLWAVDWGSEFHLPSVLSHTPSLGSFGELPQAIWSQKGCQSQLCPSYRGQHKTQAGQSEDPTPWPQRMAQGGPITQTRPIRFFPEIDVRMLQERSAFLFFSFLFFSSLLFSSLLFSSLLFFPSFLPPSLPLLLSLFLSLFRAAPTACRSS